MALQDPPHNIPRIVEVIEPLAEGGNHVVHVRMPSGLENKWPKLPWQTTIETIGIVGPDAVRFAGFVLVDTQAMKGTADLLWVFTKLPGKVVTESRWDPKLQTQIKHTTQYVEPPTSFTEDNTSFKKLTWGMSAKEVDVAPVAELAAYSRSRPVRAQLGRLPRELLSVSVLWQQDVSVGNQDFFFNAWKTGANYSMSNSASDRASSSASVKPELQFTYREVETSNLFATEYEFFLPNGTGDISLNQILGRLENLSVSGVQPWPTFSPESSTITTSEQSIRVSVNAQVALGVNVTDGSVSGQSVENGTSDDLSMNVGAGSYQIPPCIHDSINITGGLRKEQSVSSTALMQMVNSLVGSTTATKNLTKKAIGTVSPSSLPATSPTSIPTSGKYLIDVKVDDYDWDHSRIIAIVFDASNLA